MQQQNQENPRRQQVIQRRTRWAVLLHFGCIDRREGLLDGLQCPCIAENQWHDESSLLARLITIDVKAEPESQKRPPRAPTNGSAYHETATEYGYEVDDDGDDDAGYVASAEKRNCERLTVNGYYEE